jgi:hypothetical protein
LNAVPGQVLAEFLSHSRMVIVPDGDACKTFTPSGMASSLDPERRQRDG